MEHNMEQQLETPRKIRKVPPKGTPEYRDYARQAKRRSREKQKQEREAAQIVAAEEYLDGCWDSPDYARMNAYVKQESKKIADELGVNLDELATEAVDLVLSTSFGFENGIVRQVSHPNGLMVGYLFPEVIGRQIVSRTHQYGLERSATFSKIYRDLLRILDQRFGQQLSHDPIERQAALDIKAELAGKYTLSRN
jgi:hypothetical protein